jgi:hypothetical protein
MNIPQIWDAVPKPPAHVKTPVSDFFTVRWSIYISPLFACLFNCLCICCGTLINDSSFEGGGYCFVKLRTPRRYIQRGGTLSKRIWSLFNFAFCCNSRIILNSYWFQTWCSWLQLFGYKYSCFYIQVAKLRQRFYNSVAPGGLAGDRRGAVPASGFSISAQKIWKVIRENKDLDLPAHKVFNNIISRCNTGLAS